MPIPQNAVVDNPMIMDKNIDRDKNNFFVVIFV
jgi:hypothetical protein